MIEVTNYLELNKNPWNGMKEENLCRFKQIFRKRERLKINAQAFNPRSQKKQNKTKNTKKGKEKKIKIKQETNEGTQLYSIFLLAKSGNPK